MIVVDVEQNTQAWIEARLGVVTASEAKRIVTPTGKLSTAREQYLGELLSEWTTGEPYSTFEGNAYTDYGHAMEPEAFKWFAYLTDLQPRKAGFVYRDLSRLTGCSPDAMVGENIPVEFKAPSAAEHVCFLFRDVVPKKHACQCQFQIWCCNSDHGWFESFHPGYPAFIKRAEPDPVYQDALDKHIPVFIDELMAGRKRLINMGVELRDGVRRCHSVRNSNSDLATNTAAGEP